MRDWRTARSRKSPSPRLSPLQRWPFPPASLTSPSLMTRTRGTTRSRLVEAAWRRDPPAGPFPNPLLAEGAAVNATPTRSWSSPGAETRKIGLLWSSAKSWDRRRVAPRGPEKESSGRWRMGLWRRPSW
ncbi:hypothetical protein VPH35_124586 [Triticum aestivum]|uniref:Uncharacterized protein n=1 Tax=Triticum urartu TaxID=4572 RepID=A0A8R7V938_TRIUA